MGDAVALVAFHPGHAGLEPVGKARSRSGTQARRFRQSANSLANSLARL